MVSPFYSVRFNSVDDIQQTGVKVSDAVFYIPTGDQSFTNYVFVSQLKETYVELGLCFRGHSVKILSGSAKIYQLLCVSLFILYQYMIIFCAHFCSPGRAQTHLGKKTLRHQPL